MSMVQRTVWISIVASLTCMGGVWAADQAEWQQNWAQWRGPMANGVAPEADPPVTWSQQENLRWKAAVPGTGHSTPIVWQDRIFLLASKGTGKIASPAEQPSSPEGGRRRGRSSGPLEEQAFLVHCLNRTDGEIRWSHTVHTAMPHAGHHGDNSFASGSPMTDGDRLVSSFGSYGLYCHDLDGTPLWSRDFPPMTTRGGFGEGISPVLHQDTVILVRDHEGDSRIYALDAATGETRWEAPRDERSSWSTPLVLDTGKRTEVIVNGTTAVTSYDLKTGEVLWTCPGQTDNTVPAPVAGHGMVYVMSGYRGSALYAIRQGRSGQLKDTDAVAWTLDRGTPYVPSPLLYDNYLYFTQGNDARLSCVDPRDGTVHYAQERLEGLRGGYPSAVGAANRVYLLDRDGTTLVLEKGPTLKVVATNKLDDRFTASPAMAGKELFLRGQNHLYCIARP